VVIDEADEDEVCPICMEALSGSGIAAAVSGARILSPSVAPAASAAGAAVGALDIDLKTTSQRTPNRPASSGAHQLATPAPSRASSTGSAKSQRDGAPKPHPRSILTISNKAKQREVRMHSACAGLTGKGRSLLKTREGDRCKTLAPMRRRVCTVLVSTVLTSALSEQAFTWFTAVTQACCARKCNYADQPPEKSPLAIVECAADGCAGKPTYFHWQCLTDNSRQFVWNGDHNDPRYYCSKHKATVPNQESLKALPVLSELLKQVCVQFGPVEPGKSHGFDEEGRKHPFF